MMKIVRLFLLIIHLVIIALLLGVLMNDYVSPHVIGYLGILALGFPVLMIINIALIVFWIISWKKRAFVFLAFSIAFINPTRRWINYTEEKKQHPNLKLISFNGKFGKMGNNEIYQYLNQQKPNIVFFQEYDEKKALDGLQYAENNHPIVKIQSRFPIVESGLVKIQSSNGICIYADIMINEKIIRCIDVYLEPFALEKKMVKPVEDMNKNEEKARKLLHKLITVFKKHATQVEQIKEFANTSPYPVIIAGDFNAVPNSYEYYTISKGLNDAFFIAGKGSGTSFHDFKYPIKIDHVFSSESIKPVSYKVDRSVKISDHFPIIAEFEIN